MVNQAMLDAIDLANRTLIGPAGLISSVQEILAAPGEPRLYTTSSVTAALDKVCNISIPGSQGASGFSREEAWIGAIGETVERYCAACYEWENLIYASKSELGNAAIGLDQFGIYTEEIYNRPNTRLQRWHPDLPTYWVAGRSMHTGELRYVPAILVYTPFRNDDPHRSPFLGFAVSSGQACHTDLVQAQLSGLCEAIERDAFMISWMRRIPPTRIDYRCDPYLNSLFERYFQCKSLEFHVFTVTLDIQVPTALCVTTGNSPRGQFMNIGVATRPSEREAILKAMKEATQGAVWARDLIESKPNWRPLPDFSNIWDFEDHVRLYCEPDMAPHMDFIMKTEKVREVASESSCANSEVALQNCLNEVQKWGLEAIEVNLTTPEIAELGFHVPKIMVPGLAALTSAHILPALATPRFNEVPKRLGLTDPIHSLFHPAPHPFP